MNTEMTPREAADIAERLLALPDDRVDAELAEALIVLRDHARATSPAPEGGDLAEIADELDDLDADRIEWRDRRRYARLLRAHRCAPTGDAS